MFPQKHKLCKHCVCCQIMAWKPATASIPFVMAATFKICPEFVQQQMSLPWGQDLLKKNTRKNRQRCGVVGKLGGKNLTRPETSDWKFMLASNRLGKPWYCNVHSWGHQCTQTSKPLRFITFFSADSWNLRSSACPEKKPMWASTACYQRFKLPWLLKAWKIKIYVDTLCMNAIAIASFCTSY